MRKIILLFSILILLFSCEKGEREETEGTGEKGVYPDVILSNASCIIGEEGSNPLRLSAGEITFYSIDGYALLEDMTFSSESDEGITLLSGKAGEGKIETSGSLMELKKGVEFSDEERGMRIKADQLIYDRDEDTIAASGSVVVESKEGSFRGRDFLGDLRSGIYTFSVIEEGELTLD